ncbi:MULTISPECIES: hypothetical protein [Serratia]|uniref:hypothetical protein n=1 Tax=Serratia TaxID=613 RepID=UPI0006618975|nr:hypothetical protein [Serratia sp. 506_PEND]
MATLFITDIYEQDHLINFDTVKAIDTLELKGDLVVSFIDGSSRVYCVGENDIQARRELKIILERMRKTGK